MSEKNLREMAKILLVDALASLQEYEETVTVLHEIAPLTRSGEDLMDTVPEGLGEKGVSLDVGIGLLLPEMKRLVEAYDEHFAGKVTVAELAEEFGDRVYTSLALQAVGHGVSPSDEPGLDEFLRERGTKFPHGYARALDVDEGLVADAAYAVEDELARAIDL